MDKNEDQLKDYKEALKSASKGRTDYHVPSSSDWKEKTIWRYFPSEQKTEEKSSQYAGK